MNRLEFPVHISELIARQFAGKLDEGEKNDLDQWLQDDVNRKLYEKILEKENLRVNLEKIDNINVESGKRKLTRKFNIRNRGKVQLIRIIKYAAVILLPLIAGAILAKLVWFDKSKIDNLASIVPGKPKAILELSDGRKLDLENETGQITEKDGTTIDKSENSIVYASSPVFESTKTEEFNTLSIPIGGEYKLVLSDGTNIWLNAGSQLRYPVCFDSGQRMVYLEGEACFEVVYDSNRPFVVMAGSIETRVLGTVFNIMAYADDYNIKTTLVEGSVELKDTCNNNVVMLEPGYQAIFKGENPVFDIRKVNTAVFTAWKDGRFEFENEPLGSIMKKVGRWYNTEILFQDEDIKDYKFSARLKRYDKIETLLSNIEMTKKVKFYVKGNQITISRNN